MFALPFSFQKLLSQSGRNWRKFRAKELVIGQKSGQIWAKATMGQEVEEVANRAGGLHELEKKKSGRRSDRAGAGNLCISSGAVLEGKVQEGYWGSIRGQILGPNFFFRSSQSPKSRSALGREGRTFYFQSKSDVQNFSPSA